uniref:dihydrofolate reductase n=1 Tax=Klebsiella pneumoniae TaxID=573 RepID=L0R5A9_KLEPN|nr:dihydrofolate reductase [Klebsiella pneumoniae]
MAAKAKNGVIGCGPDIPWSAKGEQLLFKALTYNQWLLVGRKTFESMGALPNRKYAVVTRSGWTSNDDNVVVFQSIEEAMDRLAEFTGHVIVSGGGEIYRETLPMASTLHLSTIDIEPEGDVFFRHCCKVSDEAAFCLIQRPYISKTLLTRRISPRGSP